MADGTEKSALERIAEVFAAHGVRFVVIGGQAEVLHGSPRVTYDVDLCYSRTTENLHNLANALVELKVTLRGAPADLPFRIDCESLALGSNFMFCTTFGDLDLLGRVEPLGGYEEISQGADHYRVGDFELCTICLDDLITIKQYLGRPKDREALFQLLAIRRIRDESGS